MGGSPNVGIATGAISPYVNTVIKEATKDSQTANILAHAIWGAIEAGTQGRNTAGGAVAGTSGEITANILSQALYNQPNPEQLTEEQKRQISALSQAVAGIASGVTSATTGSSGSLAVAQNAQAGMQVAKSAVENNYLSNWQKTLRDKQLQECNGNIRCKLNTQLYWSSVDVGQDASFGAGVVASIPEKAGVSGAYNTGVETGKLLQETVGVLAGGAGVAKAGSKVVKELGSVAKRTISKNVMQMGNYLCKKNSRV